MKRILCTAAAFLLFSGSVFSLPPYAAAIKHHVTESADTTDLNSSKPSAPNDRDTPLTREAIGKIMFPLFEKNDNCSPVPTDRYGDPVSDECYLYRSMLSGDMLTVYDEIKEGLLNCDETILPSVKLTCDELRTVYHSVIYDIPDLFYVGEAYSYRFNEDSGKVSSLSPEYNSLAGNIKANRQLIDSSLEPFFLLIRDTDDPAQIVKLAHDYVIKRTAYRSCSSFNQSAFSTFVMQETVCAGYAKAFQYLMHKCNIPCAYITGTHYGEPHAWNLVEINGSFYENDLTWDDLYGEIGTLADFSYFNLTTEQMMDSGHQRDSISENLPYAVSTELSYANHYLGSHESEIKQNMCISAIPKTYNRIHWYNRFDSHMLPSCWQKIGSCYITADYVNDFRFMYDSDRKLYFRVKGHSRIVYLYDEKKDEWAALP